MLINAIPNWMKSTRSIWIILGVLVGCAQVNTGSPILELDPSIIFRESQAKLVCLQLEGAEVDRKDWMHSVTVSRLFSSRVENQAGSLRFLLEPAIREALRRRGYRTCQISHGPIIENPDFLLSVEVKKNLLSYLPPQEFIQTPRSRRPGHLQMEFLIETRFGTYQKSSHNVSKNSSQKTLKIPLLFIFKRGNDSRIDDNKKRIALSRMGYGVLRKYAETLLQKIPPNM